MTHEPKSTISKITFVPIHQNKSHVGFVSFMYTNQSNGHEFMFKQVAIHERRFPKDGLKYRLVYPQDRLAFPIYYPTNRNTQQQIEQTLFSSREFTNFLDRLTQKMEKTNVDLKRQN